MEIQYRRDQAKWGEENRLATDPYQLILSTTPGAHGPRYLSVRTWDLSAPGSQPLPLPPCRNQSNDPAHPEGGTDGGPHALYFCDGAWPGSTGHTYLTLLSGARPYAGPLRTRLCKAGQSGCFLPRGMVPTLGKSHDFPARVDQMSAREETAPNSWVGRAIMRVCQSTRDDRRERRGRERKRTIRRRSKTTRKL